MDEAMLKSGQFPNVAIEAGTDPAEVMREHGQVIQNGEKYELDTREKLNEELMDSCLTFANGGGHLRAFAYVSDLLDRQDAITRRECERLDFKAITAVANIMNADLTAERDQLSRDLDAEHALVVQFEHDNEELRHANNTLRASVAGLKMTVERFKARESREPADMGN